jgi:hypothetical protein
MPYNINKSNGVLVAVVQDGTVDNTLDISLIGRNYAGYGEVQNENFVRLLENFANQSEPPRKIEGQIWFDSSNKKLKFYDGTKFRTTGGAEIGENAPSGLTTGDFWYNTTSNQLFAWGGSEFILVGPQSVQNAQSTEMLSTTMTDIDGITRPVVQGKVNGAIVFVISNTRFTVSTLSANLVSGFLEIYKGITLPNTNSDGITTDYKFWGTASNATRFNNRIVSDFLSKSINGTYVLDVPATFVDQGFTVGNNSNLKIFIDNGSPAFKNQSADGSIIFKTVVSEQGGTAEKIPVKLQGTSLLPGVNSSNNIGCNIGSTAEKFNKIYSVDFYGTLRGVAEKANSLYDGQDYRVGSKGATVDTVAVRYLDATDGKVTITSDKFEGLATRAANLNGGTAWAIPYQTASNSTAFLSKGTSNQVLITNTSGQLAWTSVTTLINAGQASEINIQDSSLLNSTHYITFTRQTTGFQTLSVDSDLKYNPNGNILTAGIFNGLATYSQYGDLAEKYLPDSEYDVGTVVMVGGEKEITAAQPGFRALGVISEKPGYLMNSELEGGQAVALKGRVPVKVTGSVIKGQRLIASTNGTAQSSFGAHTDTFAIALETNTDAGVKLVECIVL